MQTLAISPRRRSGSLRMPAALAVAIVALVLLALGAALPWVTVFRGLEPVAGFVLEGGPLAGALLLALGLVAVAQTMGGSTWLKPIAAVISVIVGGEAVLLQGRILEFVADPGPAGPLTQPTAGIGAGLMALAAVLVLVAAVTAPGRPVRLERRFIVRIAMSVGLFVAGWVHLLLVPEHLGESAVLGLGFLVAGIAQVALAAIVLWRPQPWSLAIVVAMNVTLIAIYAYAVLVGLPFGDPGEHADAAGLVLGAGEPVDWYGAISKVAELVSLAIAFMLLSPTAPQVTEARARP